MIVTCPACAAQFRLPDGALGATGRKLRCSACRHVWFEAAPAAAPEPEATVTGVEDPPPAAPEPPAETIAAPPVDEAVVPEEAAAPEAPVEEPGPAPAEEPAAESAPAGIDPPEETATADALAFAPAATAAETEHPTEPDAETATAPPSRPELRVVPSEPATEEPPAAEAAAPSYDIRRVVQPDAAPEERPAPRRRARGRGLLLILLLLAGALGYVWLERDTVLRTVPQAASVYGLAGLLPAASSRGLDLQDLSVRVDETGGGVLLVVSGTVRNIGNAYRVLPDLRALLVDEDYHASVSWDFRAIARGLGPGDATLFEAVWADPPRDGSGDGVFVTFTDRL